MDFSHGRHSNGSSTNSSSSSIGSGGGGREINIAVLGSKGVGKSAIIVRYLTRRFIGDYDPEMDAIFTHSAVVDGKQVVLHIMDSAWHGSTKKILEHLVTSVFTKNGNGKNLSSTRELRHDPVTWADGFLLVFSVTDPDSWACAQELVTHLRLSRGDERLPIALAANKCDLIHLRRVTGNECAPWAAEHSCGYREVSASEDPDSVEEVFASLCRQVRTVHRKREKLSWIMQRPAVAAKLQIRQSLRNLAEKKWRSRTSTF